MFQHRSMLRSFLFVLMLLGASSMMNSCSSFNSSSVQNTANLGVSLSELMNKATSKYTSNSSAIKKVTDALNSTVKRAESIKNNKYVADSWKALQNNVVNPFLAKWKTNGTLDRSTINAATAQVAASIANIAKAEVSKK
jgi:hypothetical protein